jgi:GntR family transcriptional repressor for pyruvate dehydrogenase complex
VLPLSNPLFKEPEREPSRHERVVQRLHDGIASGHLQVGDHLPSERELCEQLGVSRTVVREAIRVLAAQGVLTVRQGRRAVVTANLAAPVRASLRHLIAAEGHALADLMEARQILEVSLSALAARRATEEDIAAAGAALEGMRAAPGSADFAQAHEAFHLAIARASRNPVLLRVIEPIIELLRQTPRLTREEAPLLPVGYEAHLVLFRAIRDHRPGAARRAMSEHLADTLHRHPALDSRPTKE